MKAAMQRFKDLLPGRLRHLLGKSVISIESDGLCVLLPDGADEELEELERYRFHLTSAASAALGRPTPVDIMVWDELLDAEIGVDALEGDEIKNARLCRRAERDPAVSRVLAKFEGTVTCVEART